MTKNRMTKEDFMFELEILAERASESFDIEVKFSSVVLFTIAGCLCMGEGFLTALLEASEKTCLSNVKAIEGLNLNAEGLSLKDVYDSTTLYDSTTKGN